MTLHRFLPLVLLALASCAAPAPAAERTQVYSLRGADCAACAEKVKAELSKLKGYKRAAFDTKTVEMTVTMTEALSDAQILAAIEKAGLQGVVGAGSGQWLQAATSYRQGADVKVLSQSGEAVGPLDKLRVAGKFTVFDFYADWCGPCKLVDEHLKGVVEERDDVAIRKLNVVDFDSKLSQEMGPTFEALPYVVIFSPAGKKTAIEGFAPDKMDKALAAR